ncbi:Zn-dependent exopeptidase [Pluteus cervinus]|uniref:Zn-dependent exopeptidase n=1 Tax=Pluteus cervinus TaxID=181527 RepID=A0ACD3ADR4_9AGAR|nr:Zn-dependent exopeptidase [Pluteus cervinus]
MQLDKYLGFPDFPTSIFVAGTYLLSFLGVLVNDQVSSIPHDTGGLDIEQAYSDLREIASQPRPYASHANDHVRSYLLSRLRDISDGVDFITVEEDLKSTASWFSPAGDGIVFEDTNILVKVEGLELEFRESGGVLFSAHYDSVSTAPGVIDDGIGVVTLVQFVEHLTKNRPQRTAVFNINNGEEDGLNGAHAYLEHPWSRIPDTFLNLEGAGNGGRPLLFRTSSITPVLSFADHAQVPHPHANVLAADAFARGVIRSGTDFSVYNFGLGNGTMALEGIDFAFYQGRSLYHTPRDNLQDVVGHGSKEALWTMMETVKGVGWALLNEDETHVGANESAQAPVYFDVFGSLFIVFTQQSMFNFDVSLLVLGPLIFTTLYFFPQLRAKADSLRLARHRLSGPSRPESSVLSDELIASLREQLQASTPPFWSLAKLGRIFSPSTCSQYVWPWARFWVAFILALGLGIALVALTLGVNPNIGYSHPLTVLTSFLSLSYLVIVGTHRISFATQSHTQQKVTTSIQLYIFSWILLVIATMGLNTLQIGGTYFLTAWSLFAFLGSSLTVAESIFLVDSQSRRYAAIPSAEDAHILDGSALPTNDSDELAGDDEDTTEHTPLMIRPSQHGAHIRGQNDLKADESVKWWSAQLLLTIPIPIILVSHVLWLFTTSLNQTLSDGSSPVILYGAISILSLLIFLPIAPFTFKISIWLDVIVLVVFLGSTIHNCIVFPFNESIPLKVFFQQRIELDLTAKSGNSQIVQAVSSLTGLPKYVDQMVIPHLRSARGKTLNCTYAELALCQWESDLYPSHGSGIGDHTIHNNDKSFDDTPWLQVATQRLSSTSAVISVQGTNTRGCKLYFDTKNISNFHIDNPEDLSVGSKEMKIQPGYPMLPEGAPLLRLWSRTWDRNFTVEVEWDGEVEEGGFGGRAACIWAEYESGMTGRRDGDSGARIPALEEVFDSVPSWVTVSKRQEGLVEAWAKFAI